MDISSKFVCFGRFFNPSANPPSKQRPAPRGQRPRLVRGRLPCAAPVATPRGGSANGISNNCCVWKPV
jgi:hypothetical protein